MFSSEIIIFASEIQKKTVSCSTVPSQNSSRREQVKEALALRPPVWTLMVFYRRSSEDLRRIFGGRPMGFDGIYMGNYTTFMGNYNIGIILG